MEKEKKLIKNTALYMLGNITSKLIAFFLLPLYTHFLSKAEMGTFDLFFNAVSLAIPLVTLSVVTSIFRYVMDSKGEQETNEILSNGLFVTFSGFMASLIPLAVCSLVLHLPYFGLSFVMLVGTALDNTWKYIARALKYNRVYAVSGVVVTLVTGLTGILFIAVMKMGLSGILLSYGLAPLASFLYMEWKIKVRQRVRLDHVNKPRLHEMLRYSLPLMPTDITWWLILSANRFFIKLFLGVDANGIYAVSTKFPSLMVTFNALFNMAWTESAIENYTSVEKDAYYTKIFNTFARVQFTLLIIILPAVKYLMGFILEASFLPALHCIPPLMLGSIFQAFSVFYGTGFLSSKDTKQLLTITALSAVVNLAVICAAIPLIGLLGAAIANVIGFAVMWLLNVRQTRKIFTIRIHLWEFLFLLLLSLVYIGCYYLNLVLLDGLMFLFALLLGYLMNKDSIAGLLASLKNRAGHSTESSGP